MDRGRERSIDSPICQVLVLANLGMKLIQTTAVLSETGTWFSCLVKQVPRLKHVKRRTSRLSLDHVNRLDLFSL